MNKFIYILIISTFVFTSCGSDFLDSKPTDNIITELAITNINEANYAINGVYNSLQYYGYYGAAAFYIGDVKGDDMQSYTSSSRTSNYCYLFDHKASGINAGATWSQPYFSIRLCYNIINAIESGAVKDGSDAEKKAIIGHAKALIALCHFDLTKLWGYPYGKDNGASLGVPIIDHVLLTDEHPNRSTVKECFDFIIKQLEEAIPMMSDKLHNGRMNSYGARALLSRVYLYANNYQKSYEVASGLIDQLESNGVYKLYTNENYMKSFGLDSKLGSEALVEIVNSTTDNQSWDCLAYLIHPYGYRENILTADFQALLESDPNDVRINMMRIESKYNNRPFLNKYPGPNETTASRDNNYTIIRLSEVYLIAAEAATHLGASEKTKGLYYLNSIVSRGNPSNIVDMANYDLDSFLPERRKELVGEGHRYFDLLRNGKKIIRKGGYHLSTAPEEIDWNYEKCVLYLRWTV